MKKKEFRNVLLTAAIYAICILTFIVSVNIGVDSASVIRPQHTKMAKLVLNGNTVAHPQNYNERNFQVCIVHNMKTIPETIVIGSSRGMYLGREITKYENIYNNCISGACLEDYYALLGLYEQKFNEIPARVIIEVSPWVFYKDNPEARWLERRDYIESACYFYRIVNNAELPVNERKNSENSYISFPYFRYNIEQWWENGNDIFLEEARISIDSTEAAKYPDGTSRYKSSLENENMTRLANVQSTCGACIYQQSDKMTEVDSEKSAAFESLIDYLQDCGTEVIIYMQPFSVTQCKYALDEELNPGFPLAYEYLLKLAEEKDLETRGSYDARDWGLTDERFIDFMHLDKKGVKIVWDNGKQYGG